MNSFLNVRSYIGLHEVIPRPTMTYTYGLKQNMIKNVHDHRVFSKFTWLICQHFVKILRSKIKMITELTDYYVDGLQIFLHLSEQQALPRTNLPSFVRIIENRIPNHPSNTSSRPAIPPPTYKHVNDETRFRFYSFQFLLQSCHRHAT